MQNKRVDYFSTKMEKKNPFSTPEGYFEHFTERLMSRLPEEEKKKPAIIRHLRPLLHAAIFTGVIVLGATFLMNGGTEQTQKQMSIATTEYNDSYFDDAADYAMVDNQDIYAYLLADL